MSEIQKRIEMVNGSLSLDSILENSSFVELKEHIKYLHKKDESKEKEILKLIRENVTMEVKLGG